MTVPLYVESRLKQAGAFERLVCAEWRYTKNRSLGLSVLCEDLTGQFGFVVI